MTTASPTSSTIFLFREFVGGDLLEQVLTLQ